MIDLKNLIQNCENLNINTSLSDEKDYQLKKCNFKL